MQLSSETIGKVFEENYEWFKGFLKSRFISLNDYDIEDIVQQAAIILLSRGDITGISNLTSYIYTMLQNGAVDYFKKRKRETLTEDDCDQNSLELEQSVLVEELKQIIKKAIDSLDDKQRFVFIETQLKGRSYDELCKETGEKLGTLLSRKSRASSKVKKIVERYIYEEELKNG